MICTIDYSIVGNPISQPVKGWLEHCSFEEYSEIQWAKIVGSDIGRITWENTVGQIVREHLQLKITNQMWDVRRW